MIFYIIITGYQALEPMINFCYLIKSVLYNMPLKKKEMKEESKLINLIIYILQQKSRKMHHYKFK